MRPRAGVVARVVGRVLLARGRALAGLRPLLARGRALAGVRPLLARSRPLARPRTLTRWRGSGPHRR